MDIEIKIDANCVSTEFETILFIKSLIDCQFVERLQFIKSTYRFARADFIILNTENISRFSAVFLKSCKGVVMDYIFINFIEKKRKTLGKW